MVRALLIALAAAALVAAACSGSGGSGQAIASVVHVQGEACGKATIGGGVVVAEGQVLTNAHIVAGLDTIEVRFEGQAEGTDATIVGFDPNRDLALLELDIDAPPVALGTAEEGTSGRLVTIDADGVVAERDFEVNRPITATGEDIYGEMGARRRALEVALAVTGGESGSGLFNDRDRLIGLVFATSTSDFSVSYAVAPTEIESFLAEPVDGPVDTGPCL